MKRIPAFLLLSSGLLLSSCINISDSDGHTVKGSGNVVPEARQVSQFDRVALAGSGHLSIIQGEHESLTIRADDNLLPLIQSEVSGGVLKLGPEHVNLKPSRTIEYLLELKHLKELHLSGSLDAEAPSLEADQLLFTISGSGNIRVAKLKTGNLEVHVSGSGDLGLAGKADHQTVHISGAGNYRAGDCESQTAAVHISGSGNATVWARVSLEAQVSGSGDVGYYGSPQVNSQISGSGGIHSLGNK